MQLRRASAIREEQAGASATESLVSARRGSRTWQRIKDVAIGATLAAVVLAGGYTIAHQNSQLTALRSQLRSANTVQVAKNKDPPAKVQASDPASTTVSLSCPAMPATSVAPVPTPIYNTPSAPQIIRVASPPAAIVTNVNNVTATSQNTNTNTNTSSSTGSTSSSTSTGGSSSSSSTSSSGSGSTVTVPRPTTTPTTIVVTTPPPQKKQWGSGQGNGNSWGQGQGNQGNQGNQGSGSGKQQTTNW